MEVLPRAIKNIQDWLPQNGADLMMEMFLVESVTLHILGCWSMAFSILWEKYVQTMTSHLNVHKIHSSLIIHEIA